MTGGIAGGLVGPLINFRAIRAEYLTANARQLQSVYNYQRVIINAFTEVINRLNKVENYRRSIEIKKMQVERLVASVETANRLYQNAQTEYIDVLFAQRDLWDARAVLIETKESELTAIADTYQALGGGWQNDPAALMPPIFDAARPGPHFSAIPPLWASPPMAPGDPANPARPPGDLKPAQPGDMKPAQPGDMKPAQPGDMKPAQPGPATDLPPAAPAADMPPAIR